MTEKQKVGDFVGRSYKEVIRLEGWIGCDGNPVTDGKVSPRHGALGLGRRRLMERNWRCWWEGTQGLTQVRERSRSRLPPGFG